LFTAILRVIGIRIIRLVNAAPAPAAACPFPDIAGHIHYPIRADAVRKEAHGTSLIQA
jgi:hypothetical protein